MIPALSFADKDVALFGLGRSGRSAASALIAGGARVHAWDDSENARVAASNNEIELSDLYKADWSVFSALVLSPGIPLTHPKPHSIVKKAQAAGIEIIGDVELFAREIVKFKDKGGRYQVLAVTGTNGKSTTTALIEHLFSCCGVDAYAAGNIGTPILDLPQPKSGTTYVIEMSSFQIDLTPSLRPDVAVLINISEDHLDRHGDMQKYIAAKKEIFDGSGEEAIAVVGVDDPYTQEICTTISSRENRTVIPISVGKALGRGVYVIEGVLYDGVVRPSSEVIDLKQADALLGGHNWQNAAAAFAATRDFVRDRKRLGNALLSFPGLAHRLEEIATSGNVKFINDSKATNAEATANALAAFDQIYWILGGIPKEGGIDKLRAYFPRVKKAYLIGEAANAFSETLSDQVSHLKCDTLDVAVKAASKDAMSASSETGTVLLSPACASFDQFRNFEARGDAFRDLVNKLEGIQSAETSSDGENAHDRS